MDEGHPEPAMPEDAMPADEPSAPSEEPAAPGDESAAMDEPAAEGTPPAEAEEAPEGESADVAVAEPAEAVAPRPEDFAAWEDKDFRSAKEDRDPKLLDAVAYLGESASGDAEAAELLVELLTTSEDPEPEPKPEPKVEKKPEKKKPAGYDEYGTEGGMPPDMGGPMPSEEMSGMDESMPGPSEGEMYAGMEESMAGPGAGGGGYGRQRGKTKTPLTASYVSLTGGIVRALGANGTKQAHTAMEQLLAGKIPVSKERAAAGAVLRTLIDYPSPENDELLRKALTSPESLRPNSEKLAAKLKQDFEKQAAEPKEGEDAKAKEEDVDALVAVSLANTVTAEDIRDTVLPLVERSASMRLRYDLAAYMIGNPSEEIGSRLEELLTVTDPLNVQAQIGLYRYAGTPDETRASFERYFTSYALCTLGRILQISTDEAVSLEEPIPGGQGRPSRSGFGNRPSEMGPGAEPGMEDPTPPADMGPPPEERNRQEEAMAGMEGPMDTGRGPGGQGQPYKPPQGPGEADKLSIQMFDEVAAEDPNLPYELARQLWGQELARVMTTKMEALESLEEGAQLLMLAGHIPTDTMRAQLYRTLNDHWVDGPEAFASAAVTSDKGISDPGFITVIKALPRREPPARAKTDPTEEMSAQYGWMETVYGTVRVFCERFQTAADNQMLNQVEVLENLPFRPHSTENLTHVYAFDWQKQVGNRLSGAPVDPMRIYYLRFEETGLYSKVLGAYKRAVPRASMRLVKDGSWIDGAKTGPDGLHVSMDAIIDRTDFNPNRRAVEPEPLVTQVLYIEVNDPRPAKETSEE